MIRVALEPVDISTMLAISHSREMSTFPTSQDGSLE